MKRVFISAALMGEKLNELAFVRSTYIARLVQCDLVPIIVSPLLPWGIAERLYQESAGVLFLGGHDLAPDTYGETPHPETKVGPRGRDDFELLLARRAIEDRKPILAICRGCQLLAVSMGGSLFQHIPEVFPGEVHELANSEEDYAESVVFQHDVDLTPNSRIAKIFGATRVATNSAHHQAVRDPGRELVATGRSGMGCIEFLEHSDPSYFCLGAEGHPEAMVEPYARRIFRAFAEAL